MQTVVDFSVANQVLQTPNATIAVKDYLRHFFRIVGHLLAVLEFWSQVFATVLRKIVHTLETMDTWLWYFFKKVKEIPSIPWKPKKYIFPKNSIVREVWTFFISLHANSCPFNYHFVVNLTVIIQSYVCQNKIFDNIKYQGKRINREMK